MHFERFEQSLELLDAGQRCRGDGIQDVLRSGWQ
jgi:hypothetical protein